jgi:hypothetical protein
MAGSASNGRAIRHKRGPNDGFGRSDMKGQVRILAMATLLAASNAYALECSAKLDKKTGTVLVAAKDVTGSLTWGATSGDETNAFFNAAECVPAGSAKAKNCTLGEVGTAARITPPPMCAMYVKDESNTASCFIVGCVVGVRDQGGVNVKDEMCAELGAPAGCDLEGMLGRNWRLVFVADGASGNAMGGLAGADARCQAAAFAAKLPGIFQAWLSDDTYSPSTRFITHSNVPYRLVDGTKVADDWTDLTDGSPLDASINRKADGTAQTFVMAWTGTTPAGTPIAGQNCSGWASASGGGVAGVYMDPSFGPLPPWTDATTDTPCSGAHQLYCFQQ